MASCMTLKRSFDHDRDPSNNSYESRSSTSSKRPRRHYPVTVVSSSNDITDISIGTSSVFPDIQPVLTADVLLTRIKEEVRRLQRRHQLKVSSAEIADDDANTTDSSSVLSVSAPSESRSSTSNNPPHLLTLKQVNMICARLLKEREEALRDEYDRILSSKLNEQYEGFVRFTQDQLTRRFSELQFSYVS